MNYNDISKEIINKNKGKKILLHSCCGPCSTSTINKLKDDLDITILFYNPNIEPKEEYEKRKEEQLKVLKILDIKYLDIDYLNEEYRHVIKGYENEPEGGLRCNICYELRLDKTAALAKDKHFDLFGTTLTVSPYKSAKTINEIGLQLEKKYNITYLISDFKKEDGYKNSIKLSKEYNIYRQEYCGCIFSKRSDINEK